MATQKGRNWSSGDIVTAANLSSIERGVSAVAEEYTPTTWANGNTVTAAGLNNIEQGIVSGGSSDFSTAEVTFVNNGEDSYLQAACCYSSDESSLSNTAVFDSGTYNIILYKGGAFISVPYAEQIAVSGDIEMTGNDGIITGDCTITISDSSGVTPK